MKNFILLITLFLSMILTITSCNEKIEQTKTTLEIEKNYLDSVERALELEKRSKEFYTNLNWDTVGVDQSGLIITEAKFYKEKYSSFKSIKLKYKNVSGKKIKAIKFKWYGINAFGEPTKCGNNTFGGGFDDGGLGVDKSSYGIWSVMNRGGDEIVKAWPTEIVFGDGSKWKSALGKL